ncbi:MAG: mechanosensitive ion channel [Bacteriovoracaceae bacterium]|nr:mechanosensitive ion channel [Bacteriovoracaceae bacterium]
MEQSMDSVLDQFKNFIFILKEPIFQINGTKISIFSFVISISLFLITVKVARYIAKATNAALEKKEVDSGLRNSIEKFVRYIIITLGMLFSLDNLGISINSLAALSAVLMVGIGFGLQNITQNFISGIILLIERPVKVGDIIQVGETSGRIVDIHVRSTMIQTRDDVTIMVPNSKLLSEDVINDSYTGERIRQHVKVGVAYSSDVNKVMSLLVQAASMHPTVLQDPPPIAIFENFGESSLDFDLRFWSSDIWYMDRVASDIRVEIMSLFRAQNIEIPFPQRDLHIKSEGKGPQ